MADNKKNIILIGMMGCGKSTIGHLLDQRLSDFFYVDIDMEIEKAAQKHIPQIFTENGEEYFRELEHNIIKKFCNYHNQVISTGGGIVEKKENMNIMRDNGVIFYLKADAETLFERVKKNTTRPMLFHENPKQRLKDLMKRREPFYALADFTVETEKKELVQIVDEIKYKYECFNNQNS